MFCTILPYANVYADVCPENTQGCSKGRECTCNSNGQITESVLWNGFYTSRQTYKYDDSGNLIWSTSSYPIYLITGYAYTYDSKGNMTSKTTYSGSDNINNKIASNQSRYTYDADGNMISETIYNSLDNINTSTPSEEVSYSYNGGRQTSTRKDCTSQSCESIDIICAYGNISGCSAERVVFPDGTSAIYKSGKVIRTRRIYTLEEATRLSKKTGNTFRLRYK